MDNFQKLYEFVEVAKRQRKYPENTANGYRAALKIFEQELNPAEVESVDLVADNIEEIYRNVVNSNKNTFSLTSLSTYKTRVAKVVSDYLKYGTDPLGMQTWNPKLRNVAKPIHPHNQDTQDTTQDTPKQDTSNLLPSSVHKIDLALRPGQTFTITLPPDLKEHEAEMIINIITSLVSHR